MFKFVILLSAIACVLGAAIPDEGLLPQLDGRIVGGEVTTVESFPFQISLLRFGFISCGGSVINDRFIVTAAHCLQSVSASSLRVRAGSSYWNFGGVLFSVAAIKQHERYDPNTRSNDIAVIRLSNRLSFGSNIQPIGLASRAPSNGAAATVSGWGTQSILIRLQMQYIDLRIVDRVKCLSYGYSESSMETVICAAASGKDACQGDSGGPLVSGGQLAGVVSWSNGCGQANYPALYSDVAKLRSWVLSAVDEVQIIK